MGSEANQINSSANETLSSAASTAIAGFNGFDSHYGEAAKQAIDSVVQSVGAEIEQTDPAQLEAIQTLTSKSVSLINSATSQFITEYANSAIANAVDSANNRTNTLDDSAKSSATVAIANFADSSYRNVATYATPSEAIGGVDATITALNSVVADDRFSSAQALLTKTANSLMAKTALLGADSAANVNNAITSTASSVNDTIKNEAVDITNADSLASDGVEHLNSLATAATASSANEVLETTYYRYKQDLNQISDEVAQVTLNALDDITTNTYEQINQAANEPQSASVLASSATSAMDAIFANYGASLVAAGISEYTSAAREAVAYLSGTDLSNAASLITSANSAASASAADIDVANSDAVDRYYGLIPIASYSIQSVANSINASYADQHFAVAASSANQMTAQLKSADQAELMDRIDGYLKTIHDQVNGGLDHFSNVDELVQSAVAEVNTMVNDTLTHDPYASARQAVDTAASSAYDRVNGLDASVYSNAASAVNTVAQQAYQEVENNRNDEFQLTQIATTVNSTIEQAIDSYANAAAYDQLTSAVATANSMIDQISNSADQSAAASQVAQQYDEFKMAMESTTDIQALTATGVSQLNSTATSLIANDPIASAHYALQTMLSSATEKAVGLNSRSRNNADSELAGIASRASAAMDNNVGNANALSQDVSHAASVADEVINRYNADSAKSEMHELNSEATYSMRHIADHQLANQAASAVDSVQNSLMVTLNRNAQQTAAISSAMSAAYSSVDSITAHYIGNDTVAAAYSAVDSVTDSASADIAQFDARNRGNANREVINQLKHAKGNLASTHDHNAVVLQMKRTVTSILNRYALKNAKEGLQQAADAAIEHLDAFRLGTADFTDAIRQQANQMITNVTEHVEQTPREAFDLQPCIDKLNQFTETLINNHPQASAANSVRRTADQLLSERSAADFDFANLRSAIAKTTSEADTKIYQAEDTNAVEGIASLAINDNQSHFNQNVAASATMGLTSAATELKQQLQNADIIDDAEIKLIVDKYTNQINKDASQPKFADLDLHNGIRELRQHFTELLNAHPQVASAHQISQHIEQLDSMATGYMGTHSALDRDLYRISNAANEQISQFNDATSLSATVASASVALDSVAHSHVASSATARIKATNESVNHSLVNISETGKLIDVQNGINSIANQGLRLIQADVKLPSVVHTDLVNTIIQMSSMAQAAISDDVPASAINQIDVLVASNREFYAASDSHTSLSYDSEVAQLVVPAKNKVASASNAAMADSQLTNFATQLDRLTNRYAFADAQAQVINAADDAKQQLAQLSHATDQITLQAQIDSIADKINQAFKIDLADRHSTLKVNIDTVTDQLANQAALKTDLNNVLAELNAFVADHRQNDQYATAINQLDTAIVNAHSTAADISGRLAANLNSEVANVQSSFATQAKNTAHDGIIPITSLAINKINTIKQNYVAAAASNEVNQTLHQMLAEAHTYDGADINSLSIQLKSIVEAGLQIIDQDDHDLNLVRLDAKNTLAKMKTAFKQVMMINETTAHQYEITILKASATAKAGSMDSLATANMSSALNRIDRTSGGQLSMASARMDSVVNSYYASLAQSQVSTAANTAHQQVLQLSNVTQVSTSAAINSVVNSINTEIQTDSAMPTYTQLDAADGVSAINSLLSSAVANDSAASLASFASQMASSAYTRMGSLNSHDSLITSDYMQQLVDRAAGTSQPDHVLTTQFNAIVNEHLEHTALARLNQQAKAVRLTLKTSSAQDAINDEIERIIDTTRAKIKTDIENAAYLSLDITNGIDALRGLVTEYQNDSFAAVKNEISSSASALSSWVADFNHRSQSNVSSAIASVARAADQQLRSVDSDASAADQISASAASHFGQIYHSFVADSANEVMQNAITSAQTKLAIINDLQTSSAAHAQLNQIATSYTQLITQDAHNASLAALDADNAVLEVQQLTKQMIDSAPLAAATYEIQSAVSSHFSNADLMTASQSDNYASAVAKVTAPLSASQFDLNNDEAVASVVSSIKAELKTVANQYYGQWAHSAVSQATDQLLSETRRYNDSVRAVTTSAAAHYQAHFAIQAATDEQSADLVVLDAQNAVSAMHSVAAAAAGNDPIAFANAAISTQFSSANSVLAALNGQTDSTADLQMNSVANQANEKLGSVYNNWNAVMAVVNSASSATKQIADGVIVSSAQNTITSVADSLMAQAGRLLKGDEQSTLISRIKHQLTMLNNQINGKSNYPALVSMVADSGMAAMVDSTTEQFKRNQTASAAIALDTLAASATNQVGALDSFASANFSSAVNSVNERTNAYLADKLGNAKQVNDEIKFAGQTIDKLITETIAKSANGYVTAQINASRIQLTTIADVDNRSQAMTAIDEQGSNAASMITSDVFDYRLATLDANNAASAIASIADAAVHTDAAAVHSLANASALSSAHAKVGHSNKRQATIFASHIAALNTTAPADYQAGLDSIANEFIRTSATTVVNHGLANATSQVAAISDHELKNTVLKNINEAASQANDKINVDTTNSKFASLDANNATSSINSMVNDAIERNPVASASAAIGQLATSVRAKMAVLNDEQTIRFDKQVAKIINSAGASLVGPFTDKNNVISDATSQMTSLANDYMLSSAYDALSNLASSASIKGQFLDDNNALNTKTFIDSALSAADSQISAHSASNSLVADAINAATTTVDQITSDAVANSPIAAAQSSLAAVRSSATSIAASLSGRNAANFSSAIASVADQATETFNNNDQTGNQQTLQSAAQFMHDITNYHAAEGAMAQINAAASVAGQQIERLADAEQRQNAAKSVSAMTDEYLARIHNDINNWALINLDVVNGTSALAAIANVATQEDPVASVMIDLDHYADSLAIKTTNLNSLASAKFNSVANDINSDTIAKMKTANGDASLIESTKASAIQQMNSLLDQSVIEAADNQLHTMAATIKTRLATIQNDQLASEVDDHLDLIQQSATANIKRDAYSQAFVELDLSDADTQMHQVVANAVNSNAPASAAYQIQSFIDAADQRTTHLNGSAAANFSSASKRVVRQANQAVYTTDDQSTLNQITAATSNEIDSMVSNYLVKSAYDQLRTTKQSATNALHFVTKQSKSAALKQITETLNSTAQLITADASDDQLISLDAKQGQRSVAHLTASVVASQPIASAHSMIASNAVSARQTVDGMDSFAAANLSSAINRFQKEAQTSMTANINDETAINSIQLNTINSINNVANSYVASSASKLITSVTKSAYAVINQFNNRDAASTASQSIEDTLNSTASEFTKDRGHPDLISLDAQNAIDAISSAAQFITITDEVASGNVSVSNVADSAYAATARLGNNTQLTKQIHDILTDTNAQFANGESVDPVVNDAIDKINAVVSNYVEKTAQQQLAIQIEAAQAKLQNLLSDYSFELAQPKLQQLNDQASATLSKDVHDGELIQLDLFNIEQRINKLVDQIIADDNEATALSAVAQQASAAVQNGYHDVADDDYLNFSSAVNSVFRSFAANESNQYVEQRAAALSAIDDFARSYVTSQALNSVTSVVNEINQQANDLSNFVTQSATSNAVHQIANQAAVNIKSDHADFKAVSLDADNAISSARAVLDSAIANDSIAAGKRSVSSVYSSAATFAKHLTLDDSVEFSMALASQASELSFGVDIDNSALATAAASSVAGIVDSYVFNYASAAIDQTMQTAIANLNHVSQSDRRSEFIGILNNVVNDLIDNVKSDNADQSLVDIDVQNGIMAIDSLADSMIRSDPGAAGQHIIASAASSAVNSMATGDQYDEANFRSSIDSVASQASLSVSLVSKNLTLVNKAAKSSSNKMNNLAINYRGSLAKEELNRGYESANSIAMNLSDKSDQSMAQAQLASASDHYASLIDTDAYNHGYLGLDLQNGLDAFNETVRSMVQTDSVVATSLALSSYSSEQAARLANLPASVVDNFANEAAQAISQTNGLILYAATDNNLASTAASSANSLLTSLADSYLNSAANEAIDSFAIKTHQSLAAFVNADMQNELQANIQSVQSSAAMITSHDTDDPSLLALDVRNAQLRINALFSEAITHDVYTSANYHVRSVADSLIRTNPISAQTDQMRFQLAMDRAVGKANDEINGAGMNNDLINATVDSTAAMMQSVASQFAIRDAHQQVHSIAHSATQELAALSSPSDPEITAHLKQLTKVLNQQIDQYATDKNARNLMLRRGQTTFNAYVDSLIAQHPQASASAAVHQFATAANAVANSISDSNRANYTSEIAMTKSNADSATQELVNDSQTADNLSSSAADSFMQLTRKYVANEGYQSLNAAASSASLSIEQLGLYDQQNNEILTGIIREFNSMVNSDAEKYDVVALDCHNASLEIEQFVADIASEELATDAKWYLRSAASSAVNSMGIITDSHAAANFSSAVEAAISSADGMIDHTDHDSTAIAASLSVAQQQINSVANDYVLSSANAKLQHAVANEEQLVQQLHLGHDVNNELQSVFDSYAPLIQNNAQVSAYASLNANNASMALSQVTMQAINANPQAALQHQLAAQAGSTHSVASQFSKDDQVRFSSAIANIQSLNATESVNDDHAVAAVVTKAHSQMTSVVDQYVGKRATSIIASVADNVNQRIAFLHDDAGVALISSVAASATNQIASQSNNSLATSLNVYDGVQALNSTTDRLIADDSLASATDRLNQLVSATTREVLMSDSLADMNFLSSVAKQSKQAHADLQAADEESIASLTDQAVQKITSVAHRYTMDSAASAVDVATHSAMQLVNRIQNNVARSQAINGVNNEASTANRTIQKDVADKALVNLDISNAAKSIQSVANQAISGDAKVAFANVLTSLQSSAHAQTIGLSGSFAANYSSAMDSAVTSIRADHQSLTELDQQLVANTATKLSDIASHYVADSAVHLINDTISELIANIALNNEERGRLSFIQSQANQTIKNDAHDVQLVALATTNAINDAERFVDAIVKADAKLAFNAELRHQASSASAKVGSMTSHRAANFSSATNRIANGAQAQLATFSSADSLISSAGWTMNSLANDYIVAAATKQLNSIVNSANTKAAPVSNYAAFESAIDSVAALTRTDLTAGRDDSAVVSLAITDMQSRADELVNKAVHADSKASALALIDQTAASLMSNAELTGSAKSSYASISTSVASSANYQLVEQNNVTATIMQANQTLSEAASHYVIEIASDLVDKALDAANDQAVEIHDVHNRNQTISAIGAQVSEAKRSIKNHAANPFFAYLDAQNATTAIARITSKAVHSDAAAAAILQITERTNELIAQLRPLIDDNEQTSLSNRLLHIGSQTNHAIRAANGDATLIDKHATSINAEFVSIANRYVASSANAVVAFASKSATTRVEGIDDSLIRQDVTNLIQSLSDSAANMISSDADHIGYASLDADNAVLSISSATASVVANDPSASANAVISDKIAFASSAVAGMNYERQSAFSTAIMNVVGSADVEFASAAKDANTITSITDQTLAQLHRVASQYVVTSATDVINEAASNATQLLDSMFDNSSANVYSFVASIVNEAIATVKSDSNDFATVSLDADNAASAIDQLVKANENNHAHSMIDSNVSSATSTADILNPSLRNVAINGISMHASAAHSAVNQHFGAAQATLFAVNSAASAMNEIIKKYVTKDPVASAHSAVATAASSANSKAANLASAYLDEIDTAISSAAVQANTLIRMNPANSLLDSQLASDAASSMNSYVNMYEAAAANEATTSYAASAYAQIDTMDDKYKQLANKAVADEVDNAKQAFAANANDPNVIFANVSSAADNMQSLVADYTAQNKSAVVAAKQSFATDIDSLASGVYSQARILNINNRGQINSLTGSVSANASVSVSDATTISSVAMTFQSANVSLNSVTSVAVSFARDTANAELAGITHDADQALNTIAPDEKQAVLDAVDTKIANVRARISTLDNTVNIINEIKQGVDRVKEMVDMALAENLRNTKDSYKAQIIEAATNAYQGVNGLEPTAQSSTNAAISVAASDANANIDQTDQLAEIQMLTSAGIHSINEASRSVIGSVKDSGSSLIASAANSATSRTTMLAVNDKSTANSIIVSLADFANAELNGTSTVSAAASVTASGANAINSAIDSKIASVINSAMAMASNLAAQNERDSVRLQIKNAADSAYSVTSNLASAAADTVNQYISKTASVADHELLATNDDDKLHQIARSGVAALQSATDAKTGIYATALRDSTAAKIDSAASSAFMMTNTFGEATRDSLNKAISQVADEQKDNLAQTNGEKQLNDLVQLTIDALNKVLSNDDIEHLKMDRVVANKKLQSIAEQIIDNLNNLGAISKQSAVRFIHSELARLQKRINAADNTAAVKQIVDSASDQFKAQINTVNSRELKLSKNAAKQVLNNNAQTGIDKLTAINDVIRESATETINELINDSLEQVNEANTVEKITNITNSTSRNINHVVKESLIMNDKMG